jgi:hypothetical protein
LRREALSRPLASAILAGFILVCVLVLPQRAGRYPAATRASDVAATESS